MTALSNSPAGDVGTSCPRPAARWSVSSVRPRTEGPRCGVVVASRARPEYDAGTHDRMTWDRTRGNRHPGRVSGVGIPPGTEPAGRSRANMCRDRACAGLDLRARARITSHSRPSRYPEAGGRSAVLCRGRIWPYAPSSRLQRGMRGICRLGPRCVTVFMTGTTLTSPMGEIVGGLRRSFAVQVTPGGSIRACCERAAATRVTVRAPVLLLFQRGVSVGTTLVVMRGTGVSKSTPDGAASRGAPE